MSKKKVFIYLLSIIGSITLLVLLIFSIVSIILAFTNSRTELLRKKVYANDIDYVMKHLKNYDNIYINHDKLLKNNNLEMVEIFIANKLLKKEQISSYYKYDFPIIDLFHQSYGTSIDTFKDVIMHLGPEKYRYYEKLNGDQNDFDALLVAVKEDNYLLVKYFIDNNPSYINKPDSLGLTPIFYTVNSTTPTDEGFYPQNSTMSFLYLLGKGADIYKKDNNGRNLLSYSFDSGILFIDYLLKHGFDINETDNFGNTILHYCYLNKKELPWYNNNTIDYLILKGANTKIKNKRGLYPHELSASTTQ